MRKAKAVKIVRQVAQRRRRMATPSLCPQVHMPAARSLSERGASGESRAIAPFRISLYRQTSEIPCYFKLPETVPCSTSADHDLVQTASGSVRRDRLRPHSSPEEVLGAAICRRCANAYRMGDIGRLRSYFDRAMDKVLDRAVQLGNVDAICY